MGYPSSYSHPPCLVTRVALERPDLDKTGKGLTANHGLHSRAVIPIFPNLASATILDWGQVLKSTKKTKKLKRVSIFSQPQTLRVKSFTFSSAKLSHARTNRKVCPCSGTINVSKLKPCSCKADCNLSFGSSYGSSAN